MNNFALDVESTIDYYPFGQGMPGRVWTKKYRFGYNGKENDNEIADTGCWQNYGMREYDARVCRFISVDPITKDYPELTPYQFSSNTPIQAIDLDGLEAVFTSNGKFINYKSGSAAIIIVDNKTTQTFSNYLNNTSYSFENRANTALEIANYYAPKAGVKGRVGLNTNFDGNVPAFTINYKNVAINGLFAPKNFKLLSDYGNIVSILKHESFHQGHKIKSFSDHAEVYLNQMKDASFTEGTSEDFRYSVACSFIQRLMNAYNQDGGGGKYDDLIKSFNDSKIDGMRIVPDFSGNGNEIESMKIIYKNKTYTPIGYEKLDSTTK